VTDAVRSALLIPVLLAAAASAQPASLRQDSIPPLPDSLRLYGGTVPTRIALPDFPLPPDALQLTLEEAVDLALVRNPDRAVSALEGLRAANDVTLGNAGYLPTLDASAGLAGSRSDVLFGGGGGGGGAGDTTGTGGGGPRAVESTALDAALGVGYTVYDGGLRAATLRRLRAEARRLALLADADAEQLALDVTAAYLDAARQADLADAFAEAVAVSEDRLRIAQAEVRIGTAAEIDAALALADYNADRAALLQRRVLLEGARATLGGLLALPDPDAVVVTDTLDLGPPADLGALADRAVTENRRVRSLEAAELAAAEDVDAVRSEYRPTVRANAGLGLTVFDPGFLPPDFAPAVGPTLRYGLTASLPLFDGGERDRRLQNAEIRVRQAELTTEGEAAFVRGRVARLAALARGFRGLVELESQNEAIARENVRVALAQLRLGFITPVDLRQVQLTLVDVRRRRVEAVYQARLAEAELRLLAGDLLPPGSVLTPSILSTVGP
jgi:outer membrane protein TolC